MADKACSCQGSGEACSGDRRRLRFRRIEWNIDEMASRTQSSPLNRPPPHRHFALGYLSRMREEDAKELCLDTRRPTIHLNGTRPVRPSGRPRQGRPETPRASIRSRSSMSRNSRAWQVSISIPVTVPNARLKSHSSHSSAAPDRPLRVVTRTPRDSQHFSAVSLISSRTSRGSLNCGIGIAPFA